MLSLMTTKAGIDEKYSGTAVFYVPSRIDPYGNNQRETELQSRDNTDISEVMADFTEVRPSLLKNYSHDDLLKRETQAARTAIPMIGRTTSGIQRMFPAIAARIASIA